MYGNTHGGYGKFPFGWNLAGGLPHFTCVSAVGECIRDNLASEVARCNFCFRHLRCQVGQSRVPQNLRFPRTDGDSWTFGATSVPTPPQAAGWKASIFRQTSGGRWNKYRLIEYGTRVEQFNQSVHEARLVENNVSRSQSSEHSAEIAQISARRRSSCDRSLYHTRSNCAV